MKKLLLIVALAATMINASDQNDQESKYEYLSKINFLSKTDARSFVMDIPDKMYDDIAVNFADIRIIDKEGGYLPYLITPAKITKYEDYSKTCKSSLQKLKKLENNKIELIVQNNETNKLIVPDKISIITQTRNYDKKVRVFGSDELYNWKNKIAEGRIFDFTDIADIANHEISIQGKKVYKYYKIVIDNFTERTDDKIFEVIEEIRSNEKYSQIKKQKKINQALKINKIILSAVKQRKRAEENEKITYKVKSFSVNEKDDSTVILLTTYHQPVSSLEIFTHNLNYSREITVEGSNDGEKFNFIQRTKLLKISIPGYEKLINTIFFRENKFKFYKITVNNNGMSPIKIKKIEMKGSKYQIRFLSDKKTENMSVLFGNCEAKKPYYEIADVLKKIKPADLTVCKLGDIEKNPDFNSKLDFKLFGFLNTKYLLYVFVGLMIILLSYAIFVAMKKIES